MKFLLIVFALGTATCQETSTRLSVLIDSNKQAVAESITSFEMAKKDIGIELATLAESVNAIKNLAGELKTKIATEVFADRFGATVAKLMSAAEQLKSTNPVAAGLISRELTLTANRGADTFDQCYNKELLGDLNQIAMSIPQTTYNIAQADIAFKTQILVCAADFIVKTDTTQRCIQNVLAALPIPSINATGLQTSKSMTKLLNCVEKGVQSIKQYGDSILQKLKNEISPNLQNLIPSQFEGNLSVPAAFPDLNKLWPLPALVASSLDEAKDAITGAKNIQAEGAASKIINIEIAKEFLKPQLQILGDFISQIEGTSTPQDAPCYLAAKTSQQGAIQIKAANLVNCVVNAGQVSVASVFNTAEASIKDIESKQNVLSPAIECSKNVKNIFDPVSYDMCLESAQKEVSAKLAMVKKQVDGIAADSNDVVNMITRCKCQAETELKREAKAEAYKLASCIAVNGKIRVEVPQVGCAINPCST